MANNKFIPAIASQKQNLEQEKRNKIHNLILLPFLTWIGISGQRAKWDYSYAQILRFSHHTVMLGGIRQWLRRWWRQLRTSTNSLYNPLALPWRWWTEIKGLSLPLSLILAAKLQDGLMMMNGGGGSLKQMEMMMNSVATNLSSHVSYSF